ncbi:MAG: hypothetical protein ABL925_03005 [Methylococcales bacterium]
MEPLTTDEIIEEIHAIRREHAANLGFDMQLILADLKKSEQLRTEQGWPLVKEQKTSPLNAASQ